MSKRYLTIALLCGLAGTLLAGCEPVPKQRWNWPWQRHEPDSYPGVRTAQQKIEELQALSKKSAQRPAAELEPSSADLARQIGQERDPLVRIEIIRTVATWPTATAEGILTGGLSDPDAEVRTVACEAWGRRGGPLAVQNLTKSMSDDASLDVRLAAARAMGRTRHPSAVTPLAEALADADPAMQHRALSSLKEVSGKDLGSDVEAWRQYARGEHPAAPAPSIAERLKPWKWF